MFVSAPLESDSRSEVSSPPIDSAISASRVEIAAAACGFGGRLEQFGRGEGDRGRASRTAIEKLAGRAASDVKRETATIHVAAGWAGRKGFEVGKVVQHIEQLLSILCAGR